jgi:hypothetical protein
MSLEQLDANACFQSSDTTADSRCLCVQLAACTMKAPLLGCHQELQERIKLDVPDHDTNVSSGGATSKNSAPQARKVLYVDGEMTLIDLQKRVTALKTGLGVEIRNGRFCIPAADHTEIRGRVRATARDEADLLISQNSGIADVGALSAAQGSISSLRGGKYSD